MNNKEIKALVSLLDDEDQEVASHVEEKIFSFGTPIIPILENEWETRFNPTIQRKIEDLIHALQFQLVQERLIDWKNSDDQDLLKGLWIIATYQYPDLDYEELTSNLEQLYIDTWRELKDDLSPFDQVRIINSVLFDKFKFRANTKNFHSPANSMIHRVMESRKGNPISLSAIYLLIAKKLDLPIYGVNLPNLFILMYDTPEIKFYINVFNRGLIFSRDDIDNYIVHLQLTPLEEYYVPCSHLDMILRFLRNLVVSFDHLGEYHKSDEIKMILKQVDDLYEGI